MLLYPVKSTVVIPLPGVDVAGVSRRTAEVPPLVQCPVVQGWRWGAPVVHSWGQELVEQHTPGVGQLQQGEQDPHQHLVPENNSRRTRLEASSCK